jgi:hypothetical protein
LEKEEQLFLVRNCEEMVKNFDGNKLRKCNFISGKDQSASWGNYFGCE